ncbi:hypothetical protein FHR32_003691 [Streptosporangium album]|uniref:Uncharacterized protein n=1 Tax=Streptosporangium album TaxID=47479 RepID=A0A7W7RXX9_9ACTN|nr:hypothetical protein [Streptosporangium album]MBB4939386.1 hypothetical protein [Streptosporangium album]
MTLEELAQDFPNWVIWRGRTSTGPEGWYATRRGASLSEEELSRGMAETISGGDATELLTQLREQGEIGTRLTPATFTE